MSIHSGEKFDNVIKELIDFLNYQVGMYMDAMSGFAGHQVRIERQVFRANRPGRITRDARGIQAVMWDSYEDPGKPEFIHNRIVKVKDFLTDNSASGRHERQLVDGTCVFVFSYWDEEIRPRLARSIGKKPTDIRSAAFGDLRLIRHAILHNRRVVENSKYLQMTMLRDIVEPDEPLSIDYEDIHQLFVKLKKAAAQLMFEWLGVEPPGGVDQVVDIAIQ